jgi:hypothetical protein
MAGLYSTTGGKPPLIMVTGLCELEISATLQPSYEAPLQTLESTIGISGYTTTVLNRNQSSNHQSTLAHQGPENDLLFNPDYIHPQNKESQSCRYTKCDQKRLIDRGERAISEGLNPYIHYGTIASGNLIMKNAEYRDQLREETDAICVETEETGLLHRYPYYLAVRGICDYSDSHKNKMWQPYAALTAAAYTSELLAVIPTYSPKSKLRAEHMTRRTEEEGGSSSIQLKCIY